MAGIDRIFDLLDSGMTADEIAGYREEEKLLDLADFIRGIKHVRTVRLSSAEEREGGIHLWVDAHAGPDLLTLPVHVAGTSRGEIAIRNSDLYLEAEGKVIVLTVGSDTTETYVKESFKREFLRIRGFRAG